MFDRRLIEYFDWGLLLITIFIGCIGLGILYSAVTAGNIDNTSLILFKKQIIWICFGFIIMCCSFIFHYKYLNTGSLAIYIICICLLICVVFFGKYVGGSKRWISFGFLTMQPSELMKLALIIIFSSLYSKCITEKGLSFKMLVKPCLLLCLPFILIIKQPDLGTAILLFLITASITLFVKVEKKVFLTCASVILAAAPLIWLFMLMDYQKTRILVFLNPDRDPLGAGYHIIQSKIAIGSGMLTGKGFLKGTQNILSFLPEQHTDFILSVLAEEWGFVGCSILLFLYFFFLLWGFNISYTCRDIFGSILAFGITIMIFWQIFINIGMVMGLMPVVGVPLPLISYGGSSVITNMVGIGILFNISMRRFAIT